VNSSPANPAPARDRFVPLALGYLLLPALVFLLTWVRPAAGVPVALVTLGAFAWFWRTTRAGGGRPKLAGGTWAFILALALLWTFLAGVGGFLPQASDYEKHNLAFHDLLHQAWPVRYVNGAETNYLCYGLGYYLTPALIARLAGENVLPAATFLWGFAGVALFFYWVATLSRSPRKMLAIVLVFATTETLWHAFLHVLQTPAQAAWGQPVLDSLVRLGVASDYSDTWMSLQFRPQHVISAWLGAALFYELFWVRRSPRGAALVWAAGLFWSPLMCVGLLLIPLAGLGRWRWRAALEPVNAGGLILLAVLAVYFQGHVPLTEKGPVWTFSHGAEWLVLVPVFLALELSPMLFLYLADRKYHWLGELRPLFVASFLVLLLLPVYKIGYYGDLRLQAGTTALLFCGLAAGRIFLHPEFSWKRPLLLLLVASQLAGAAYPFGKWGWQCLRGHSVGYTYADTQQRYGYRNLSEFKRDGYDYAAQYLGRPDSAAARWLLK